MKKVLAVTMMMVVASFGVFGAEAAAEVVKTNPWAPVIGELLQLVIQVVSPILVILASWAAWKLGKKLGIEKNAVMDDMLRNYVQEGIDWADAWAKTQTAKPTGEQKNAEAIKHILELVKASPLPDIAEDKLKKLVEAKLAAENKQVETTA